MLFNQVTRRKKEVEKAYSFYLGGSGFLTRLLSNWEKPQKQRLSSLPRLNMAVPVWFLYREITPYPPPQAITFPQQSLPHVSSSEQSSSSRSTLKYTRWWMACRRRYAISAVFVASFLIFTLATFRMTASVTRGAVPLVTVQTVVPVSRCLLGRGVCVYEMANDGANHTFTRACQRGYRPSACRCSTIKADSFEYHDSRRSKQTAKVASEKLDTEQGLCTCTFESTRSTGSSYWIMALDCKPVVADVHGSNGV